MRPLKLMYCASPQAAQTGHEAGLLFRIVLQHNILCTMQTEPGPSCRRNQGPAAQLPRTNIRDGIGQRFIMQMYMRIGVLLSA